MWVYEIITQPTFRLIMAESRVQLLIPIIPLLPLCLPVIHENDQLARLHLFSTDNSWTFLACHYRDSKGAINNTSDFQLR